MKKKALRKLTLSKETLQSLDPDRMKKAAGGAYGQSCFMTCVAECDMNHSFDQLCESPYTA